MGCPLQAIVAPCGLDERTVASWWERAGQHCQDRHAHLVQTGQVALGHGQADKLWVKLAGWQLWQAMALVAPSRLWLGGVISPTRDLALIRTLLTQVRACARHLDVLVCGDGLASSVRAVRAVLRAPVRSGRRAAHEWCVRPDCCWPHQSLRLRTPAGRWQQRTPSDGRRPDRSRLDPPRAALLPDATGAVGRPQTTWPTPQTASRGGGSVITLK